MLYFKLFENFILENENILTNFKTYSFSNKISQSKDSAKNNAINIKEVIHKACEWTGDKSCFIFLFEICFAYV